MPDEKICLDIQHTTIHGSSYLKYPSCSFTNSSMNRNLVTKMCCDFASKFNEQVKKYHHHLGTSQVCMAFTKKPNQKIQKDCFLQLVSNFSHFSSTWYKSTNARVLLLIILCCMLSADVSCVSVKFPNECVCSRLSSLGPLTSVNCSSLNLHNYTIDFTITKEYNSTKINSTTISDKEQETIGDKSRLYYFDLSHNQLTSVEPDIQDNIISINSTFEIHVHALIFSFNNINHIQASDLNLYTGVVSLDLSHNQLQWLDADAFVKLQTLEALNLSHNTIKEFANNMFHFLNNLKLLDVSYNNLFQFPLPVLSSLQRLYLNNNNLQSVAISTSNVDSNLPSLLTLDLSYNQLKELHSGTFIHFPSMKILNLTNCLIQEISEDFLKGLQNLEELILDQNDISAVTTSLFHNTSLVKLSIASMPRLQNISHDAFIGLSSLVYLNLSDNPQFSFIHPNLFTPLVNLQKLDVSNSSLTQLSQITFHRNTHLIEINLLNNPFLCTCTNAWLVKEASNNHTRFLHADSLRCFSDGQLQTDLHHASFNCEEIFLQNFSSRISAKLGSKLLFKCQHHSQNPGVIMWTTPSGDTFYQHHFHPDASQHLLSPEDIAPDSKFHKGHYWHHTSSYHSELSSFSERMIILSDGSLYIDYMLRTDAGPYKCQVSNIQYNESISINLYVECALSGHVKIFGCITGLICALSFFTLNLIYVIISWTARRLVNKRRREIIRQMLENLNAYKSTQIGRIHENYTHQISRVRNQYHTQCARLHRNYTSQVTKVKRGCSNQVERVRENYNSKLAQLRDYSSNQIMQIRERANGQIIRIRDYGATQLEKLRETYKFQHQHVLKLLDTMNLENCRNIVETECMRAESMMYDIDLLGDDDRTDSPTSPEDSEYSTAASSPSSSPDGIDNVGLRRDMSHNRRELSTDSNGSSGVVEMQTTIDFEAGLIAQFDDTWKYGDGYHYEDTNHDYLMNIDCLGDSSLLQLQNNPTTHGITRYSQMSMVGTPLPTLELNRGQLSIDVSDDEISSAGHVRSDSDGTYITPEASPTKVWSGGQSLSAFEKNSETNHPHRNATNCDISFTDDTFSLNVETIM